LSCYPSERGKNSGTTRLNRDLWRPVRTFHWLKGGKEKRREKTPSRSKESMPRGPKLRTSAETPAQKTKSEELMEEKSSADQGRKPRKRERPGKDPAVETSVQGKTHVVR